MPFLRMKEALKTEGIFRARGLGRTGTEIQCTRAPRAWKGKVRSSSRKPCAHPLPIIFWSPNFKVWQNQEPGAGGRRESVEWSGLFVALAGWGPFFSPPVTCGWEQPAPHIRFISSIKHRSSTTQGPGGTEGQLLDLNSWRAEVDRMTNMM